MAFWGNSEKKERTVPHLVALIKCGEESVSFPLIRSASYGGQAVISMAITSSDLVYVVSEP